MEQPVSSKARDESVKGDLLHHGIAQGAAAKKSKFIQGRVRDKPEIAPAEGRDRFRTFSHPESSSQHEPLSKLRLVVPGDQISYAAFVQDLGMKGIVVRAVVSLCWIPGDGFSCILFGCQSKTEIACLTGSETPVDF